MLAANIKNGSGTQENKIRDAIRAYNNLTSYVDRVYACYNKFSCVVSAQGCDNPNNLMKIYGSSAAEVEQHLVNVTFMDHTIRVHEKAAPYFQAVENDIKSSGTTYAIRNNQISPYLWKMNANNGKELSLHSFGIAVDINQDVNCNGCTKSDIPPEVSNAFKSHGFRWGLDYKGKKDPMHFEWLGYDCKGNLITK